MNINNSGDSLRSKMGTVAGTILFGTIFLLSLISSTLFQNSAHALANGAFVDKHIIKVGSDLYKDTNPFDGTYRYTLDIGSGCQNVIDISDGTFDSGNSSMTANMTANITYERVFNNDCQSNGSDDISLSDTNRRLIMGYRIDTRTIFMPVWLSPGNFGGIGDGPQENGTYQSTQDGDTEYLRDGNDYDDGGTRVRYNGTGDRANFQSQRCNWVGCDTVDDYDFTLANGGDFAAADATVYPAAPVSTNPNDPGALTGGLDATIEEEPSCETTGFTLGWITCGIINGLAGITQGIFGAVIEPYLRSSPVDTTAAADNPIFVVWSSVRNIANIILIFALLFVVFGQAIGGGLVDAYTAKKIMPRLLVSAILINISIYIVAILVDIFNVVGSGIGNLILTPFKDTIYSKFHNNGAGNAISVGLILASIIGVLLTFLSVSVFKAGGQSTVGALGSTFWPFMHFILVFVLVPAVLITLAIFATLIIRQGIILILIVTAPLAFAFFAIPNTEKYFKKWWEILTSTLMVYPIMTVIFSFSIVMSALAYNSSGPSNFGVSNIIATLVAFIILIVPLVLIPFSFKLAGGILGNLMNTSKGLMSRATSPLQHRYKEQKSLEKKALFDDKWRNADTGLQKRMAAKASGRPKVASRIAGWGSGGSRRRSASNWAGRQVNGGGAPDTQEALDAGLDAEQAAIAIGLAPAVAAQARAAATAAHTAATATGTASPEAARAAARAAGSAVSSGRTGQQVTNAGAAAAAAYDQVHSATGSSRAAEVGAAVAGTTASSGSSREATASAARVAAEKYTSSSGRLGDSGAQKLAQATGESAALAHDVEVRRNGGNHGAAAAEATKAGNYAERHFDSALTSTGSQEAAHTAALAGTEALLHRDSSGNAPAQAVIVRAATEAASVHSTGELGGQSAADARLAGLQHGRTIR